MVQPCLYNRKEYKVICINQEPLYIASIGSNNLKCTGGINKSFVDKKCPSELFSFCKQALAKFKSQCPYAITEGLFRIDVFQMKSGKFVVNELESLEATYYSTNETEFKVTQHIENYWENQIRFLMQSSFNKLTKSIYKRNSNIVAAINCSVQPFLSFNEELKIEDEDT